MIRRMATAGAVALLAGLGGCTTPASGPAADVSGSAATFTCCEAADVNPVRHPGETFAIHWIMNVVPVPRDSPTQRIVLHAALSNGHGSVEELKNVETTDPAVMARFGTVTTNSSATSAPVTTITIPPTAQPGFYSLTFSIDTEGAVVSGASVIRVEGTDGAP